MNGVKFKISRFENRNLGETVEKIVGFNVELDDESYSMYSETILSKEEIDGKTPEECVDLAFTKLSSSLATSANKLLTTYKTGFIGSYYIPN